MSYRHDYCEFIDGPQSYKLAGRTILRKGGGSNNQAAEQEAARQDRINSGTEAVNRIFGIGSDDEAAKNSASRASMYDTTKNDTRTFFSKQLEEDKTAAERDMKFQKARLGIIGSSQANDLDSEFQKRYDKGLLDVANRSDSAATDFRTNDEQSRLNLISKIVAGMDQGSAASNALSTLQSNAESANQAYQSQRMSNVFSDLLDSYAAGKYISGTNAASAQNQNTTGNYFTSSGNNGTVTKG